MVESNLPQEFLDKLKQVTGKRARVVVDHILEHGFITTEQLTNAYGYSHPPRAIRDVREQGIPIETFKTTDQHGKAIAAYRFGNPTEIRELGGRRNFSKAFKQELIAYYGHKCAITNEALPESQLQIDHRIPYHISGDDPDQRIENFMLLSSSANRMKSWTCERCPNWQAYHDPQICKTCYWAFPLNHEHAQMIPVRRTDIVWRDAETQIFDKALTEAQAQNLALQDLIKNILKEYFS